MEEVGVVIETDFDLVKDLSEDEDDFLKASSSSSFSSSSSSSLDFSRRWAEAATKKEKSNTQCVNFVQF